jgi:hypothetical protein
MCFRTTLTLATLFLVCFKVAGWSEPRASQPTSSPYHPVDGNTKIETKLDEVGAAATIDYRAKGVNNFAVRIAVHPAA